jgi:hypothetical protein
MSRLLGWVATIGLSVGVTSLGVAYALGGRDLGHLLGRNMDSWRACKGSGDSHGTAERHLGWTGGDAVEISLPAMVRLSAGDGGDIVVRGSSDLIDHVEIDGRRIKLDCRGTAGNRDIEIDLPGRFRRIGLSGSGRVVMDNLDQHRLALRIAGSGNVIAKGTVDHLHVTLAGSGNAQLARLAVKDLKVEILGSGTVDAAAKDEADIKIAGSGDVRLHGKPAKLKSHIAGSGSISQLEVAKETR